MNKKTGILISNLGTPVAPTQKAVRAYLKEFLSDPRVIDLPRWKWWPILNFIILNIRPKRSARNYQKVWTPEGSPLLVHSQAVAEALQKTLPDTPIALGMRYAQPSLKHALLALRKANIERLIVLPLYPQYSATTTATTFEAVMTALRRCPALPEIHLIRDYHDHPLYIAALKESVLSFWQKNGRADKLMLSFHGLPQRYITQGDPYFSQCQRTTQLLTEALNLKPDEYIMTFQSRVGFEPWLQPYTDHALIHLAQSETKKIQVICPGFACDCLETLEEININYRQLFLNAGGQQFDYIPCLNQNAAHIALLLELVQKNPYNHNHD
ncbi:MAG: ferrochelatase [Gammaproteobacteria bacterium]|nr:ferrochelatase [Gammaproteobacteria bacterium]